MLKAYTGISIALRAVNEPAVTDLGYSPLATEASDRIDEFTTRLMEDGPWWFQQATHYASMSAAAGNEKPFAGGEIVTGTTTGCTFYVICISKNRVWLKYIDGTIAGTGEVLTGSTTGATMTTNTAYTVIDTHTTWSFDILPEPFAQYIAQDAGFDLERQYKRGAVDEQVLGRTVARARAQAEAFDAGWMGWRTQSQPGSAQVIRAYQTGPDTVDRFTDD